MLACASAFRRVVGSIACTAALLGISCGPSEFGKLVPVNGKVTLNGEPLTDGTVVLAPARDNSLRTTPNGAVDESGSFRVSTAGKPGAPVGWYTATYQPDEQKAKRSSKPMPSKYASAATSPLSIQVVSNPQPGAYDLHLTTDQ